MTPEHFLAAVEKIVGVPADPIGSFPVWTLHMDPFPAQLSYREDVKVLEIRWSQFVPKLLEQWGANPYNGTWHIWFKDFNNDPDAVLRELTRRLAKVGYAPPASSPRIAIDYETVSGSPLPSGVTVAGSLTLNLPDPDEGFRWVLEGTVVFQKPIKP